MPYWSVLYLALGGLLLGVVVVVVGLTYFLNLALGPITEQLGL